MLNFCMFNAFSASALIPDIVTQRNIFYKQHKQAFYPAASYVAADAITAAPFHAFDCFVFGSLLYFMCALCTAGFRAGRSAHAITQLHRHPACPGARSGAA